MPVSFGDFHQTANDAMKVKKTSASQIKMKHSHGGKTFESTHGVKKDGPFSEFVLKAGKARGFNMDEVKITNGSSAEVKLSHGNLVPDVKFKAKLTMDPRKVSDQSISDILALGALPSSTKLTAAYSKGPIAASLDCGFAPLAFKGCDFSAEAVYACPGNFTLGAKAVQKNGKSLDLNVGAHYTVNGATLAVQTEKSLSAFTVSAHKNVGRNQLALSTQIARGAFNTNVGGKFALAGYACTANVDLGNVGAFDANKAKWTLNSSVPCILAGYSGKATWSNSASLTDPGSIKTGLTFAF